jgi:predicted PurR-regulated permease PerM
MLGFDRRAARYIWTAALVVLMLALVYLVRRTLFIFILALLFAYLLSPLVNLLDRALPASRTRTPALALAYIIFVGAVVLVGIQIGSRVVEQANHLATDFPALLTKWQQPSPNVSGGVNSLKAQAIEKIRMEIARRSEDLVSWLPKAGLKLVTIASDLVFVVIIPILAFFFLKDGRLARHSILAIVEEGPRRAMLDDVLADIDALLAHYMRALVALSLATFTAYGIFFSILGVPYGVLLAALACLLEFIPMVGPLTASLIILLVNALTGGHVLAILIFLLVYRMFQDYMLSPHLMGQGVEVHPLLVLFGVFAGAEVAGIAGTFLSVPVLALIRILYLRMRKSRARPEPVTAAPPRLRGG